MQGDDGEEDLLIVAPTLLDVFVILVIIILCQWDFLKDLFLGINAVKEVKTEAFANRIAVGLGLKLVVASVFKAVDVRINILVIQHKMRTFHTSEHPSKTKII